MTTAPTITIYVRHSAGCKYAGDEFSKRCECRKWLRWTPKAGKRQRKPADTRSWAEAEQVKRDLEDQLAGRSVAPPTQDIAGCVSVFVQDKRVQGVGEDGIKKYVRLLSRLEKYCGNRGVFTIQGVTRDVITGFMAQWPEWYPSTVTRNKTSELLRGFLRYCYEAQWIDRVPKVPGIKEDEPETQPLTPDEYESLLAAVVPAVETGGVGRGTRSPIKTGHRTKATEARLVAKLTAFIETMRWSGLAIHDTTILRRSALTAGDGFDLITAKRKKTGTPVSVPIPKRVGDLLRALPPIGNGLYFFWGGGGTAKTAASKWGQRYIGPTFKAAGIASDGHMVSHRLRDKVGQVRRQVRRMSRAH